MKEPNKKYGYYLSDLSDEQIEVCKKKFGNICIQNTYLTYVRYVEYDRKKWVVGTREIQSLEYKNALELFNEETKEKPTKELLQERKTQLESELKEVKKKLSELEPKVGDLCVFSTSSGTIKTIDYLEEVNKNSDLKYRSSSDVLWIKCEKITDQDFINKYENYVKTN